LALEVTSPNDKAYDDIAWDGLVRNYRPALAYTSFARGLDRPPGALAYSVAVGACPPPPADGPAAPFKV
jgi:hypothetical protein